MSDVRAESRAYTAVGERDGASFSTGPAQETKTLLKRFSIFTLPDFSSTCAHFETSRSVMPQIFASLPVLSGSGEPRIVERRTSSGVLMMCSSPIIPPKKTLV